MEIRHASTPKGVSESYLEALEHFVDKESGTAIEPDNSLIGSNTIPTESSLFNARYGVYFLGENPKIFEEILKEIVLPSAGVPVLTLIAEAQLLRNRKIPEQLARFLTEQGFLTPEKELPFRMVFSEALLNAIEHGTLGLGDTKDDISREEPDLSSYHTLVQEKLKTTSDGERPVIVSIYIQDEELITWVENDGEEFDFNKHLESVKKGKKREPLTHGLGTHLIHAFSENMRYEEKGKRIVFSFPVQFTQELTIPGSETLSKMEVRAKGRVLIVDDQASNREFAKFYLISCGYKNIEEASTGEEAIEKAAAFRPDIILMDIVMPGMDGFAACRLIKQNKTLSHTPILFLSGLTDAKNRVRGYRFGAVDYVNKPINRNELIARTDTHIHQGLMFKALQEYSGRVQRDLEKAKDSQSTLLPHENELKELSEKYHTDIQAHFEPCEELAGDYINAFEVNDQHLGVILADFTGHGVAAGLNTIFLHSLVYELKRHALSPTRFVKEINLRLRKMLKIGTFATFIFGLFNTKTGRFTYVGCGAPPLVFLAKDKETLPSTFLDCSGIPLGLADSDEMDLQAHDITLQKGDSLIFYSDALNESIHENAPLWEEEELLAQLEKVQNKKGELSLTKLIRNFEKTVRTPIKDDLTLLSLTWHGEKK